MSPWSTYNSAVLASLVVSALGLLALPLIYDLPSHFCQPLAPLDGPKAPPRGAPTRARAVGVCLCWTFLLQMCGSSPVALAPASASANRSKCPWTTLLRPCLTAR